MAGSSPAAPGTPGSPLAAPAVADSGAVDSGAAELRLDPPLTLERLEPAERIHPGLGVSLGAELEDLHRLELGPALLLPGADGLHDPQGLRLDATCLRRGASLAEFPFAPPERIDPASLGPTEEVETMVFLPFLEFEHFGHLITETAGWLGPLLDPGRGWLRAAGPEAVLMVGAQAAPALPELERLLPLPPRRWRSSAELTAPLLARRVLLPVPSIRNSHSLSAEHPRHLRLLLERRLGPTTRLPPPLAGPPRGTRLYLSRSRLDPSRRLLLGEDALENELRQRGWTIAWPETQSIVEQLEQLRDASVIAGANGSAMHLLLYFGESLAGRRVINLHLPGLSLNPIYRLQASLQRLDWLVIGCMWQDPSCRKPMNVVRNKLLIVTPRRLAAVLDRLADQAIEGAGPSSSAPPRNRW